MGINGIRPTRTLMTAAVALLLGQSPVLAQTAQVAGDWQLEVESEQGTTYPTLILEQDGDMLTGHYSSATLGEAEVTGSVDGSEVTVTFSADPGVGQEVPVIYTGTVDQNGVWSGTLDIAGGLATGTFTATREGA